MQNVMEPYMKKFLDPETLTFGVSGLKTSEGQTEPKRLVKP